MSADAAMGYIKIHRELADWEWYHDDRCVRLFVHILIKANWTVGRYMGRDILPGQLVTSTSKLAEQLGWSRSAITRTLDKLKKSGELDSFSDSNRTTVTIVNWAKWQDDDGKPERKSKRNRNASDTPTGTRPDTIEEENKGRSIEERRADFIAKCREVVTAKPDTLPPSERQAFADYWTEQGKGGKMRFEAQDYFDHAARMRTWKKRAEERGGFKPDIIHSEPPKARGWDVKDPTKLAS